MAPSDLHEFTGADAQASALVVSSSSGDGAAHVNPPSPTHGLRRRSHRHAAPVTVAIVPDPAWNRAQALLAGGIALVLADWVWAWACAWPEQAPAAWIGQVRWAWDAALAAGVLTLVWRKVRARPGPGHRLSCSGEGDWQWVSPHEAPSACGVRVAIDLGDWLLLRIDRQADPSTSDRLPSWPARPHWVALSRRHHTERWHDLRLALAANAD